MSDAPKSLLEKLSAVTRACSYIQKDGVNQFHRYNYATAAIVFEKVNQALWDNRLVSKPTPKIISVLERPNAKGGSENFVTIEMNLILMDLDSEATISTRAYGSGMDNGDKAVMKAQTAALKYCWIDLLNISTGDDPEADATVDSRAEGVSIKAKRGETARGPLVRPEPPEVPPAPDEEAPSIFAAPEVELCKKGGCSGQVMTYETKAGKKYRACHAAKEAYGELVKAGIDPSVARKRTAGHTYHFLSDPKSEVLVEGGEPC